MEMAIIQEKFQEKEERSWGASDSGGPWTSLYKQYKHIHTAAPNSDKIWGGGGLQNLSLTKNTGQNLFCKFCQQC